MNRHFTRVAAAALMAITLSGQSVRAQGNDFWSWLHPWGVQDWRLTATSIGLGAGATAGYFALRKKHGVLQTHTATPLGAFALTTVGCMSIFPIVGTLWLNRPLTHREVYTGMADCVVPFVGSWLMEYAYHGQAWYEK